MYSLYKLEYVNKITTDCIARYLADEIDVKLLLLGTLAGDIGSGPGEDELLAW
jgi:hypothetical protein